MPHARGEVQTAAPTHSHGILVSKRQAPQRRLVMDSTWRAVVGTLGGLWSPLSALCPRCGMALGTNKWTPPPSIPQTPPLSAACRNDSPTGWSRGIRSHRGGTRPEFDPNRRRGRHLVLPAVMGLTGRSPPSEPGAVADQRAAGGEPELATAMSAVHHCGSASGDLAARRTAPPNQPAPAGTTECGECAGPSPATTATVPTTSAGSRRGSDRRSPATPPPCATSTTPSAPSPVDRLPVLEGLINQYEPTA